MRTVSPMPPPRNLGRRSWREVEFASLDFETTGLDRARDHIVSFGVVPIRRGRIELGEHVYREVSPSVRPSPASVMVHGLRQVDLDQAPAINAVRDVLSASLDGRYIVAWAAEIEAAFLAGAFGRSERWWRRRIVDALVLARSLERLDGSDLSRPYGLSAAAARFGVPVHSPHDALDDALTTAQMFLVLATQLSRRRQRTARWFLRAGRARRR
jgi:DNA polymerase III subunit epsilon